MRISLVIIWCALLVFGSCKESQDSSIARPAEGGSPKPYTLVIPFGFPEMRMPANNPLTEEGIALGKKLFFDNILSVDHTVSCGSCHKQELAFTDDKRFSVGVNGAIGLRNSMPLYNLGWLEMFNPKQNRIMWDGAAGTLEGQVFFPLKNHRELNLDSQALENRLNAHAEYPALFKAAFGAGPVTIAQVSKAIAQFERTMISANSKYDKFKRGELSLTEEEKRGLSVFSLESKGGCFHCHGSDFSPFFTDFRFHNNGLDVVPSDSGLAAFTKDAGDIGLFKTPSLRNLAFTAPYMHDGRFKTLEEVIEHYNSGVKVGTTTDVNLIQHVRSGGLKLSEQDKADLLAFLNTLNDHDFLTDKRYKE